MLHIFFFVAMAIAGVGCNSGKNPAAPTAIPVAGTPPLAPSGPPATPTITITAAGMTPLELTINVGQRVAFVNNDSRPHDVVGGKDPNTPDCPEIVQAGFLAPGQRSETGAFMRAQTCEYHDHTMLSVPAFQGRIIIR
jgi:plastocyanin